MDKKYNKEKNNKIDKKDNNINIHKRIITNN